MKFIINLMRSLFLGFIPKAGETVDRSTIIQFSAMVHHDAQQTKARTRPYVNMKQVDAKSFAYDGLGLVEMRELAGRYPKADFDDIEHKRRKISRKRFAVNLPIDESDVRAQLLNAGSEYSKACAQAVQRRFDRTVVNALFADVLTGEDFETSVTFANDGGLTVNATAGLTYEKLLEAEKNFTDNEVGNDMPVKIALGVSGEEDEAMMKESELTSGDFTRRFAIEGGTMKKALSMDVLKFGGAVANPILDVTGGVRSNFILAERGICFGMSKEMRIKIQERDDHIETRQVQVVVEWGAVRTEGVLVQKLTTTDA